MVEIKENSYNDILEHVNKIYKYAKQVATCLEEGEFSQRSHRDTEYDDDDRDYKRNRYSRY